MKADPLEKYGKHVSSFFVGKGKETNRIIFEVLALDGKMTMWKVTQKTLERLHNKKPTYNQIRKFYTTIFRRFPELEKVGYIQQYGTTISKGRKISIYGLTWKGLVVGSLISLLIRKEWDKIAQNYDERHGSWALKVISRYARYNASGMLITKLMIEPLKRLVLSGEINMDFIEEERFSQICQELYSNQVLRLMHHVEAVIKKRGKAKLPNLFKELPQKDLRALRKMFNDIEMKDIFIHKLDNIERTYKEKMALTRLAKKKYLEHFPRKA